MLCLLNLQKIAKKKVRHKCNSLFYFVFWYEYSNISCSFFASVHVVDFIFECVCYEFGIINGLGLLFYDFSKKKGLVKILAQSSIFLGSQTKVDFKVTASR